MWDVANPAQLTLFASTHVSKPLYIAASVSFNGRNQIKGPSAAATCTAPLNAKSGKKSASFTPTLVNLYTVSYSSMVVGTLFCNMSVACNANPGELNLHSPCSKV
eukprot:TRINITY_DN23109_c0_g1_i1.p1 TRINITY_DN23109_c0_g1~~TRINITY_DN23109_c0_g1_i1.p1  ORF type:complete len:105 (+),score=14.28 TRINITY_DN23109_c0_g1_i1:76-390(+)